MSEKRMRRGYGEWFHLGFSLTGFGSTWTSYRGSSSKTEAAISMLFAGLPQRGRGRESAMVFGTFFWTVRIVDTDYLLYKTYVVPCISFLVG